jgi:ribose transport system substrate-binding protein
MNNPFFDQARDGCKKAEEELGGEVECRYIGPGEHGGGEEQLQMVNDLVVRQVDGIAVSPSNAAAMASALQQAKDAGIPVLTWDSDLLPENKDLRIAYVGTKNYDIGVNLAKLAQQLKPEGGSICLQSGGAAAANHNERLQGIRDTLAGTSGSQPPGNPLAGQNGWTEVAGCPLYTDDDAARAVQQMEDTLAKNGDLDVFISTGAFTQWNPDAYKSVVDRHKDRVDSKDLVLLVADTLPVQMDLLKAGYSHGQVGQRPFEMGYKSMFFLQDIIESKKSPADPTYTGLDVCTPETASTCIGS